jgi:PPOX class probable F420-dependent enzyme
MSEPTDPSTQLIPDDLAYLLTTDHIGHVSFVREDRSIATTLMWVDWDGAHVVTSTPIGEYKGRRLRANPTISVSVVDHADDWRFITVEGRVTEIRPDIGLVFIDKMAQRYTGSAYRRRDHEREILVVTPDRVRFGHGGWAPRRR